MLFDYSSYCNFKQNKKVLGYGAAGLCRKFLIRPSAMLWPTTLSVVALIRSVHEPIHEAATPDQPEDIKLRGVSCGATTTGSDSSVNSSERVMLGVQDRKSGMVTGRPPISRARFFWMAMTLMACYQLFPTFLAPALGAVSLLCYMAPGSQTVKMLGSASNGFGILSFT